MLMELLIFPFKLYSAFMKNEQRVLIHLLSALVPLVVLPVCSVSALGVCLNEWELLLSWESECQICDLLLVDQRGLKWQIMLCYFCG